MHVCPVLCRCIGVDDMNAPYFIEAEYYEDQDWRHYRLQSCFQPEQRFIIAPAPNNNGWGGLGWLRCAPHNLFGDM
jgi:hypothetical protein